MSSLLNDGLQSVKSFWNALGFQWRSRLRWRRPGYVEPTEPKEALFAERPDASQLAEREAVLLNHYRLHAFREQSSRLRYLETLTVLEHLEQLLPKGVELASFDTMRWLDVGAKNWSYVEALYRFIERQTPTFHLHGIELDGYRLYRDLHSRYDYAMAHIRPLPNATYAVGDVLDHHGAYDVVSCFLPFVFLEPCLRWGLPRRTFQPDAFLQHLVSRVRPGGYLLIVNQGEAEATEQQRLFTALEPTSPALQVTALGALPASFLPYQYPRYAWRCHRPASGLLIHPVIQV